MVILLGVLIGFLVGAALCVRYLRQENAADAGLRLRRIELRPGTSGAEFTLATEARLAGLNKGVLPCLEA